MYETKTDAGTKKEELTSLISQTASSIRLEVTNKTDGLQSQITLNAQNINSKVSKNGVISEINQSAENITIKAAKIDLDGLVSANQFTSKFATIDSLNGQKARIDTIEGNYISAGTVSANYATISNLNAVRSRLETVEANYITAGTVKADYMEVKNWTSGGYIKAGKINADNITTGTLSASNIDVSGIASGLRSYTIYCQGLEVESIFTYKNYAWKPRSINGVTYLVADGGTVSSASDDGE